MSDRTRDLLAELMSDYLTGEVVEKAAKATYDEMQHPNWRAPLWDEIDEHGRERFLNAARASLSAVLPGIIRQAQAEALRDLRDHLTEPRRLWWGVMGVRVVRVIDDPRSVLALSDYLSYRADRIEQGGDQ